MPSVQLPSGTTVQLLQAVSVVVASRFQLKRPRCDSDVERGSQGFMSEEALSSRRRRTVTAIVRRSSDGSVLVVKRARTAKDLAGYWQFVSGEMGPGDCDRWLERARNVVLIETGLTELRLISQARPLRVKSSKAKLLVHAALFEVCDSRSAVELSTDYEAYEWVQADEELGRFQPVQVRLADIWARTAAYERFPAGPKASLERLARDRQHSPREIARWAAISLDEYCTAATGDDGLVCVENFMDYSWAVASARPNMATVQNAVLIVLAEGGLVPSATGRARRRSLNKNPAENPLPDVEQRPKGRSRVATHVPASIIHEAVQRLAGFIDSQFKGLTEQTVLYLQRMHSELPDISTGLRILTRSNSLVLRNALIEFHKGEPNAIAMVIVCESRPLNRGRLMADVLSRAGIPTTLITDSQAVLFACNAEIAIADVYAVRNASNVGHIDIVGEVGIYTLALAARERSIPMVAIVGTLEMHHGEMAFELEEQPSQQVTASYADASSLRLPTIRNVHFEAVPSRMWTNVIMETGTIVPDCCQPNIEQSMRTFDSAFF